MMQFRLQKEFYKPDALKMENIEKYDATKEVVPGSLFWKETRGVECTDWDAG